MFKTAPYVGLMVNYVIEKIKKPDEGIVACTLGLVVTLSALIPRLDQQYIPGLKTLYNRLISVLLGVSNKAEGRSFDRHSCRNPELRAKSFKLLLEIVRKLDTPNDVLRLILPFHLTPAWRTFRVSDWNIRAEHFQRSPTGYVGLANLGSTCYVNSLLQQLFFIPQFRSPLISAEISGKGAAGGLLEELQQVFALMHEAPCEYFRPKALCDALNVSPTNQEDVSAFMVRFFDELKKDLAKSKLVPCQQIVENLFEILSVTYTKCAVCNSVNQSQTPIYMLDLDVLYGKSIVESLRAFIKPVSLQGGNAYECERCSKKVPASREQELKVLPNVLVLRLKRFGVSEAEMFAKLNNYCEFPMELDMEEFAASSGSSPAINLPKAYYMYRLKGVIVHMGALNSGHYYSLLRDDARTEYPEDERWFNFNDTHVRKLDVKEIPEEAFGNIADQASDSSLTEEQRTKTNNAYILLYQRTTMFPPEILENVRRESPDYGQLKIVLANLRAGQEVLSPNIPPTLKAKLDVQREDILAKQFVFSPSYSDFVLNLLKMMEDKDSLFPRRAALTYFFTTSLRGEAAEQTQRFLKFIKKSCRSQRGLCKAVASLFSNAQIIREFLTHCPTEKARRATGSLLRVVVGELYCEEKELVQKFVRDTFGTKAMDGAASKIRVTYKDKHVPYLILMMDGLVQEVGNLLKSQCEQYFQLLAFFAKLGPETRKYLASCGMLGVALEILCESKGKDGNFGCTKHVSDSVPHLFLDEPLFLEPIPGERPDGARCLPLLPEPSEKPSEKLLSQPAQFVFELIHELLSTSFEIEQDLSRLRPVLGDSLKKALSYLAKEGSLGCLFDCSKNSLIVTNFLSKIIRTLCDVKGKVYSTSVLDYLTYKMKESGYIELRRYTRPLLGLMGTSDPAVFKVNLLKIVDNLGGDECGGQHYGRRGAKIKEFAFHRRYRLF